MARKKNQLELDFFLNALLQKISKNFTVSEAILFGSYAKGTATENSDIDFAIISSDLTKKSFSLNALEIYRKSELYEPGLQLLGFTPKSFYEEDFADSGFIREIKKTGKVIYKAS